MSEAQIFRAFSKGRTIKKRQDKEENAAKNVVKDYMNVFKKIEFAVQKMIKIITCLRRVLRNVSLAFRRQKSFRF